MGATAGAAAAAAAAAAADEDADEDEEEEEDEDEMDAAIMAGDVMIGGCCCWDCCMAMRGEGNSTPCMAWRPWLSTYASRRVQICLKRENLGRAIKLGGRGVEEAAGPEGVEEVAVPTFTVPSGARIPSIRSEWLRLCTRIE